jgi:hypothetical protein
MKESRTGSAQKQGGRMEDGRGEVAQIMYTHVSKCKNNKIKGKRKKFFENLTMCQMFCRLYVV